ncbi:hypothetical protein NMG60_11027486 [Bertholletia excelsa]
MDSTSARSPCFVEEDDGLASLADMEAGFSGNLPSKPLYHTALQRRSSVRNLYSVGSPRSGRFYDGKFEEHQAHFLDACFLCQKPLGQNKDIFMYRGDTPFCSEECRQEQIDMDETKEKRWNLSASRKAMRKEQKRTNSSSPSKRQDYSFHTGTVAAA